MSCNIRKYNPIVLGFPEAKEMTLTAFGGYSATGDEREDIVFKPEEVECPACLGGGYTDDGLNYCSTCHGYGYVVD